MALTLTDDATILTKPINAVFQQTFLRRAQQVCPYFTGTQPGTLTKQAGTSTIKWRCIEHHGAIRADRHPDIHGWTQLGHPDLHRYRGHCFEIWPVLYRE